MTARRAQPPSPRAAAGPTDPAGTVRPAAASANRARDGGQDPRREPRQEQRERQEQEQKHGPDGGDRSIAKLRARTEALAEELARLPGQIAEEERVLAKLQERLGTPREAGRLLPNRAATYLVLAAFLAAGVCFLAQGVKPSVSQPIRETMIPHLLITSVPEEATVRLDGERAGVTPLVVQLPPAERTYTVELEAPGMAPARRRVAVSAEAGAHLHLVLTAASLKEQPPRTTSGPSR